MTVFTKEFTVAIVRGGMCRLAYAIGLAQAGINVKIFEATAKFDEIGAGVSLGPNALRALKGLGLLETVLSAINVADSTQKGFRFVTGTGDHDSIYDMPDSTLETDAELEKRPIGIYRPTFLAALLPLLDPQIISFHKHLASSTQLPSGQYQLSFCDETTYDVDLIISADGIKSTVRNAVLGETKKSRISFVNTYVYRGMVPVDVVKAAGVKMDIEGHPYLYAGLNKSLVTYPIKDGTILNIAAIRRTGNVEDPLSPEQPSPWVQNVDQKELLDSFQDFGNDAKTILQHLKPPNRWTLHTLYPPLETYVKGRIVLVGDAAHAMLQYLGAGIGQGFEDVYALCRILAHPKVTKDTLDAALSLYDALRRPRANTTLEQSLHAGKIAQNFGPGGYGVKELNTHAEVMYNSEWHHQLWRHDLETQVSKALSEF